MIRTPVASSNLASVGYEADTRTLEVEFTDGSIYQYFEVPESVYSGLIRAASKGGYMHANVRDRYRYRRL